MNSDKYPHIEIPQVQLFFLCSVQERLTKQIAMAICEALQPKGVAVVIEAA